MRNRLKTIGLGRPTPTYPNFLKKELGLPDPFIFDEITHTHIYLQKSKKIY